MLILSLIDAILYLKKKIYTLFIGDNSNSAMDIDNTDVEMVEMSQLSQKRRSKRKYQS